MPPVPPTGMTGSRARCSGPRKRGRGFFTRWQDRCSKTRRVFRGEGLMFSSSPGDTGAALTPPLTTLGPGTAPASGPTDRAPSHPCL